MCARPNSKIEECNKYQAIYRVWRNKLTSEPGSPVYMALYHWQLDHLRKSDI